MFAKKPARPHVDVESVCPPFKPVLCFLSGPFSNQEMAEWFQAGYFTMSLLVKRGCDEVFQPLGEIIKIWGRVPFTPGPGPPPLQVRVAHQVLQNGFKTFAMLFYQHWLYQ